MQLISAPESNKHENTYPPVSILNVVPLDLPVSRKGPEYKEMHYLTFAQVTELERSIFEKCFFDQP